MTYVKNTWVDQDVERPKTYEVTNNQDGSITLIDSFGIISELGTPVNATNMNHIEDGIANNAIALFNKTDIDLTNVNNSGTSRSASWAMPSDTYVSLTIGATGSTYTAPANGYFVAVAVNGVAGAMDFFNIELINLNNAIVSGSNLPIYQTTAFLFIPVKKGDVVKLQYQSSITVRDLNFNYAVGSESEAS